MRGALVGISFSLLLVSCAPTKPVVDLKTVSDPQAYQRDLIECAVLARQGFSPDLVARDEAIQSTIRGAAVETVVNGLAAGPGGALGGMIAGGITGPEKAHKMEQRAIGRCLENRGYFVANAEELWLTPVLYCLDIGLTHWMSTTEEEHQACIKAEEKRRAELDAKLERQRGS